MKLSPEELRWLSRWEKRERLWFPVTRWICVASGVTFTGGGIFLFHFLHGLVMDGVPVPMILALVPFFFLGAGGIWFGIAFSQWHGDIKLRLLLRLIREHEDKEGS